MHKTKFTDERLEEIARGSRFLLPYERLDLVAEFKAMRDELERLKRAGSEALTALHCG